jgi:hypothetical protein
MTTGPAGIVLTQIISASKSKIESSMDDDVSVCSILAEEKVKFVLFNDASGAH